MQRPTSYASRRNGIFLFTNESYGFGVRRQSAAATALSRADDRMPPTNNYAEQSLRHPVIFRKLIFGNRSDIGADTLAINLSLIHTAKCRNREIIPILKSILLSGHKPASDFLFSNSS